MRRQIVAADLLILNKTDLITPTDLADLRTWLASLGGAGRAMINAVQGQVPFDALLGAGSFSSDDVRCCDGLNEPASGTGNPENLFVSWSISTEQPFNQKRLHTVLSSWSPEVVRVKGIIRVAADPGQPDQRVIVHRVGSRLSFTLDGVWKGGPSTLVAIGLREYVDTETQAREVRSALIASRAMGSPASSKDQVSSIQR